MPNLLTSFLGAAAKAAVNLVLPVHCLGCGQQGEIICTSCFSTLPLLERPFCDICADPGVVGLCRSCRGPDRSSSSFLSGIRAPFLMEGLVREAVHCFKYRNCRVAAPCLGGQMSIYLDANPLPGDVLVPVPLHPKKLRERGYNQAELLARELSKGTGLKVETGFLARTRNTAPQARSGDGSMRQRNVDRAFECRGDAQGVSCILVDDVCTTGSTLNACAEALAAAGASSIWALTLARERLSAPLPSCDGG